MFNDDIFLSVKGREHKTIERTGFGRYEGFTVIYLVNSRIVMHMTFLPEITEGDVEKLKDRIREVTGRTGYGAVLGLSGGIDSAVVAKLCTDAIGPEKVLCVFMPSRATPADDYRITSNLCSKWGMEYRIFDIQPAVDSLSAILAASTDTPLDAGNIAARCRMIVLYNLAKKLGRVVMGATNESETMVGYFTKFGDGACDISPLSGLYKTNVREIARIIGVPDEIIDRQPSAGLWEGQTDEEDMGMSYDVLDPVLYLIQTGLSDDEISGKVGIPADSVSGIRKKIADSEHKRMLPIHL